MKTPLSDLAPDWLRFMGIIGWLVIGVTGAVVVVAWFFGMIASVAIPLAFAVMLGVVFAPLVDTLQRLKVPRIVSAVLSLIVVIAVVGGAAWVTITSVISQWPTIEKQMQSAWDRLGVILANLNVPQDLLNQVNAAVKNALPSAAQTIATAITTGLGNTISLLFGMFLSLYMLYLVLADYHKLTDWIGGHVGLPVHVGSGIVDDTASSLRAYFRGSTIIGLANAIVIALGMWALGVPLILPVAIVTVVLGYIPFFGALVSGAFAVVIALGANGVNTAVAMLVIVLIAQNVVQMPISAVVMGDALELHPIVVLITTMIGGIFGGLIGGMLGAPVTAVAVRSITRITAATREERQAPAGAEPAETTANS
jgi:predicted PurR-regulated permease PerM